MHPCPLASGGIGSKPGLASFRWQPPKNPPSFERPVMSKLLAALVATAFAFSGSAFAASHAAGAPAKPASAAEAKKDEKKDMKKDEKKPAAAAPKKEEPKK